MSTKVVDADMVDAIRRGAEAGLTAVQMASTFGVRDTTIRKHAQKHGIKIVRATSANSKAIRNEQIKRMERSANRRKKSEEKRLKALADELARISNPQERKEALYGHALLAFEKRQVAKGIRPPLPYGVNNRPEAKKPQGPREPRSNVLPIVIDGVKFRSRTAAAEALGLGRSVFSSMIHPKASEVRRKRLRELINEYKRNQSYSAG